VGSKEYQEPLMRALASASYAALETTTKSLLFSQDQMALSVDNLDIHLG
jgi:hypothetical protein